MLPKIVVPDDYPSVLAASPAYQTWTATTTVARHDTLPSSSRELIERLEGAAVVVCIRASTQFTADVFAQCPALRLVSLWGTGTDNVDLDAAARHGVTVTNTPAVAADSIAEHCLALMLAVARKITRLDAETRAGAWPRGQVSQMWGKTLGVIGLGAIGSRFARLGRAIGMEVLTWTRNPKPELGFPHVPLERLYRESDVVSLHLRLSPETEGMVGAGEFSLMKRSAIFLNTARGDIVEEAALIEALRTAAIAGAGLDVFHTEPLPAGHPIGELDNVVLTPHSAGITTEALEAGLQMAIDNVRHFLEGNPRNVVIPAG